MSGVDSMTTSKSTTTTTTTTKKDYEKKDSYATELQLLGKFGLKLNY